MKLKKSSLSSANGRGMTAKKYIALTKISKATATRDLQDLAAKKLFIPIGEGRSTLVHVMKSTLRTKAF